ncbi:MAG: YkgJ family cysteine cluster protein [Candidatus Altiarchaeota archaeon]
MKCVNECCMYDVPLSITDTARIAGGTGLHPREFVRKVSVNEAESLFTEIRSGREYYYLFLRKNDEGYCVFHEEGKCVIHGFKPSICRLYPFTMNGRDISVRRNTICGREWNVKGIGRAGLASITNDFVTYANEFRTHDEMARGWNNGDAGSLEEFLDKVIMEYAAERSLYASSCSSDSGTQ